MYYQDRGLYSLSVWTTGLFWPILYHLVSFMISTTLCLVLWSQLLCVPSTTEWVSFYLVKCLFMQLVVSWLYGCFLHQTELRTRLCLILLYITSTLPKVSALSMFHEWMSLNYGPGPRMKVKIMALIKIVDFYLALTMYQTLCWVPTWMILFNPDNYLTRCYYYSHL